MSEQTTGVAHRCGECGGSGTWPGGRPYHKRGCSSACERTHNVPQMLRDASREVQGIGDDLDEAIRDADRTIWFTVGLLVGAVGLGLILLLAWMLS